MMIQKNKLAPRGNFSFFISYDKQKKRIFPKHPAQLTPARMGIFVNENRHPKTYPYLTYESRYTSIEENGSNSRTENKPLPRLCIDK